eukprot:CAMPEP_0115044436 /NCGR_PEP_ID=MMETSP0216-20121206/47482_1 /TAXON_ID=223996 /ORGANISM="Protocruzia adherens, Strain Boccale" /LENGTH=159 /DNA_ID=CAMNT_0002426985 /DNA_START=149 /DNA_END=624 /DNA_ORIENTATION=-
MGRLAASKTKGVRAPGKQMQAIQKKEVLSRGQRKRQEKHVKLARRQELGLKIKDHKTKHEINAKAKKAKHEALRNFDNVTQILDEMETTLRGKTKGNQDYLKRMTTKKRDVINNLEVHSMKQVMNHPTFASNPLTAIREHLQRTVAKPEIPVRENDNKS